MKKFFHILIGLVFGIIFELSNLTQFYSGLLPLNYINRNAFSFFIFYPLMIIIFCIILALIIKKYTFLRFSIGFLGGFLLVLLFMTFLFEILAGPATL